MRVDEAVLRRGAPPAEVIPNPAHKLWTDEVGILLGCEVDPGSCSNGRMSDDDACDLHRAQAAAVAALCKGEVLPPASAMRWQYLVTPAAMGPIIPTPTDTLDAALELAGRIYGETMPALRQRVDDALERQDDVAAAIAAEEYDETVACLPLRILRRLVGEWEDVTP